MNVVTNDFPLSNLKFKSQNVRSFNISTFGDLTKKKMFSVTRGNFDIIFLADTRLNSREKIGPVLEMEKLARVKGYKLFSNSTTASRGVCILIRERLNVEILREIRDQACNILLMKVKINGKFLILGSIYGPNRNEDMYTLEELKLNIRELECGNIILGGDWNCTWDLSPSEINLDVVNMVNIPSRARSLKIHEICNEFGLCDPFRMLYPTKREYTYFPAALEHNNRSRLDFFLISNNMCGKISNTFIENALLREMFDHKGIILEFRSNKFPKNKSILNKNLKRWDLNIMVRVEALECYIHHANLNEVFDIGEKNRILISIGNVHRLMQDYNLRWENYFNEVEVNIDEIAIEGLKQEIMQEFENLPDMDWAQTLNLNCTPDFFFEALCNCMRNAAIREQSKIYKIETGLEKRLNKQLNLLKEQPNIDLAEINTTEQNLENLIRIRLREEVRQHKRYEIICEEKITPEFVNMIKCKKDEDTLKRVCKDNGEEFNSDTERENFIRDSYQQIFREPDDVKNNRIEIEEFLGESNNHPAVINSKLTLEEKNSLETPLTIEELDNSVKKSKSKSAPGADGISNAFIKNFWDIFRKPLFQLANYCFERNELTPAFKSANIKLIPKKGNLALLKNWRPISLLNCFYKILSRALGTRLKKVMDKLTPVGQKGHSKTRRCQEVLINMIENIENCKKLRKEGVILSLDIKKAFDCVSHKFVEKTLKFFNFGEIMKKWLLLLSTKRTACIVLDNNKTTELFDLERGNAQGDIISPFIFNLCYQILIFKIQYDERVLSPFENRVHRDQANEANQASTIPKVVAMADDANCILKMCVQTLKLVKEILENYRLMSGFECNIDKTVLLPIGQIRPLSREIIELGFSVQEKITVVGMQISNNMTDFDTEVQRMEQKMSRIVREFSRFNLSLPGRINVAKTFLYSQINYLGSFLPLSKEQCNRLNMVIANFVAGKLNISHKRIFMDIEQSGLGLFEVHNFLQSQKCGWYRYTNKIDDYWKWLIASNSKGGDPKKCRSEDVRGHKIIVGLVEAFEKFMHGCTKVEQYFPFARIMDNPDIPTGTRGISTFNREFFGDSYMNFGAEILALRPKDFFREGQTYATFIRETNAHIGGERYNKIKRGIQIKLLNFDVQSMQVELDPINRLFDSSKKGSKTFRKVFTHRQCNSIPHNMVKYAETTESIIGIEKSMILNRTWGFNFLDNGTRTFIFKLYNNTLGVNARVSKFIRGHSDMCTFCRLNQNEEDNKESVLHFFFDCEYVEQVVINILRNYLQVNEHGTISRGTYFGMFRFEEEGKNLMLLLISTWIRKYLWDCRMKGVLPNSEQGIWYVSEKIKNTHENSSAFREIVLASGLNIRF